MISNVFFFNVFFSKGASIFLVYNFHKPTPRWEGEEEGKGHGRSKCENTTALQIKIFANAL